MTSLVPDPQAVALTYDWGWQAQQSVIAKNDSDIRTVKILAFGTLAMVLFSTFATASTAWKVFR